jgi:hypothetical protein
MKRMFCLLTLLAAPTLVSASNHIIIEKDTVMVGDTSSFFVRMINDTPVNVLNFILQYDPRLIRPVEFREYPRGRFGIGSVGHHFAKDKISLILYRSNGQQLPVGAGRIIEVRYVVADTSLQFVSYTRVFFIRGSVTDSNYADIPFKYANGTITILPKLVGAVDDKGEHLPIRFEVKQNVRAPISLMATTIFKPRRGDMFL